MDPAAVLTAYDEQIRRNPHADGTPGVVERDAWVVRVINGGDGWSAVTWSGLDERNADTVIAHQVLRFARNGTSWEWKHYSYDKPVDLPQRLAAAGLVPEPAETLLVADTADPLLDVATPPQVELCPVTDASGVAALVAVHDAVFGGDHAAVGRVVLEGVESRPRTTAAAVAMIDGAAVSAGRVEFHHGTEFASIWGGGTLPAWRGRGLFSALVSFRAAQARAEGFRYLQVDASSQSRPILERLGFVALAATTPFRHPGVADQVAG